MDHGEYVIDVTRADLIYHLRAIEREATARAVRPLQYALDECIAKWRKAARRTCPPSPTMTGCDHSFIQRFSGDGIALWACADCRLRFYPHGPECNRGCTHEAARGESGLTGIVPQEGTNAAEPDHD